MKNEMLETALEYHKAGLHVIPCSKTKQPLCRWGDYVDKQTAEDVKKLFSKPCYGMAMITGVNNIEVLDIDCKYDLTGTMFNDFKAILDDTELISIYDTVFQVTPTKGFHAIYRCSEIEGNQKLSSRPASNSELNKYNEEVKEFNKTLKEGQKPKREITDPNRLPKVLFETRGTRGYVLIDPTPKYMMQAKTLFQPIPEITPEQREAIFYAAKSFHSIVEEQHKSKIDQKAQVKNESVGIENITCWDAYNEKGDTISLLQQHGWTKVRRIGERTFLRRPAKDKGTSGNYHHGKKLFKTFSTSTLFEDGKAYSPYAVFTELEHNGNFSAAAKELYHKGFGDRIQRQPTLSNKIETLPVVELKPINETANEEEKTDFEKLLDELEQTSFSIEKKVVHKKATLHYYSDGYKYRIAGDEMILGITGDKGSGKTLLLSILLASALSGGRQILNYSLDIGNRVILDFDTEQPQEFFQTSRRRSYRMAKLRADNPNYKSYNLRPYNWEVRLKMIKYYVRTTKNVGLIIIDGIVDLIKDYNDLEASQKLVGEIMQIATIAGALVVPVLHEAKSTGRARGHLGTELENKADCILGMSQDRTQGIYTVTSKKERFKPFPNCDLKRDHLGYPYSESQDIDNDYYDTEAAEKEAYKPSVSSSSDSSIFDEIEKTIENVDSSASEKTSMSDARLPEGEEIPF